MAADMGDAEAAAGVAAVGDAAAAGGAAAAAVSPMLRNFHLSELQVPGLASAQVP